VPRNGFLIEALCERLEVKLAGLLGRAQRARKVTSGTLALELSLKKGEVCMVLAARDMGSEQFRRLSSLAESCRCPLVSYFTKDELGHLLGKGQRSAAGITNAEIAESVRRVITTIWDLKGGEEGKTRGV
jgi:ribosomal protein L7Ae-like RNA K-turn-binding protein